MKCCVECFRDSHIRSIIKERGKTGDCNFCQSKGVTVYSIPAGSHQIADLLINLVQTYNVSNAASAKTLKESLFSDWDIFNVSPEILQTLIKALCASAYNETNTIFTEKVEIAQFTDMDFLRDSGIVRGNNWDEFSRSIKYENRFHNKMLNTDIFASFLSVLVKLYPAGTSMFRGRISPNSKGFPINEMGAPPENKRSSGRINPEGVAVLYLTSDRKTVLSEVRANTFDYVTIGEFKTKQDIRIVNLSGISKVSPFLYEIELEEYAANRKVLQEIALEIAKPLRRSDSILEYLPTQYIAEFIKSEKYDGVEYASTLRENSFNLAVFDENLFECVNACTVEVGEVSYETSPGINAF